MLALRPFDVVPFPTSSLYSLDMPPVLPHPLAHLASSDQAKFYEYGIGPSRSVPFPLVHHSFEHHARTQPNAVAVEHKSFSESITYAQLDSKANRLARRLREQANIRPGKRVCIVARRSVTLVIAILAVLKAGAQYVPLDAVTITDDTLHFVLQDADPSLVLVMNEYAHRIDAACPVIRLEDAITKDAGLVSSKIDEAGLTPQDGCYCIYTSGTTGRPKGVDVRHQGVSNVISGSPGNVGMKPGLRVAQLLNIAFDMGAWEILGSLYNGSTLCIRGNSKKDWIALLKTVHIVIATPSIIAQHNPEDYPLLQNVIVGGEPCPQALADKWAKLTNFHNCCGPTEISICNTVQLHTPGVSLSIGKPIPNTNVYILSCDEACMPVPIGHVGSMWVGGIGVSYGYLNLPDKTAERWMKDPFVEGGMMFNTGDLGRWRPDGQLDHLGRADDQVKVKGFRVELDGVSSAMRTYPPVKSAVTLLINSELWGFVTPRNVDLSVLRSVVAQTQPYYAVPNHFMALDVFPHTSNGKADKRLLRALAEGERPDGLIVIESSHSAKSPTSPSPPSPPVSNLNHPNGGSMTVKVTTAKYTPPLTPAEPSASSFQQQQDAHPLGSPPALQPLGSPLLSPSHPERSSRPLSAPCIWDTSADKDVLEDALLRSGVKLTVDLVV